MMRRILLTGVMVVIVLTSVGCAVPPAEFDQAYLPNSVPGSPPKKIELPTDVVDKLTTKGLFGITSPMRAEMHWVEDDNLVLDVPTEDGKSGLYTYLIIPSSGEIKMIEGAEKEYVTAKIDKSVSLQSTQTTAATIAKALLSLITDKDTHKYVGKVENNGTTLEFDIKAVIKTESGRGLFGGVTKNVVEQYIDYTAKDINTGKAFEGRQYFNRYVPIGFAISSWLKGWRVSPDGNYYMIWSTLVDLDKGKKPFIPLIKNFYDWYEDITINPQWTQVALLASKKDENKRWHRWIEFYPFSMNSTPSGQADQKTSTK